jgi:hypothetical protein
VLTPISEPDPTRHPAGAKCYRLNIDTLWLPTADGPWTYLISEALKQGLQREDFVWFSQHFILGLEAPPSSADLTAPGPAEKILLDRITDEVGAGQYPNKDRGAVDVGAQLIAAASAARTGRYTPTKESLLQRTSLRDDFGKVAKAFPVDNRREVDIAENSSQFLVATEKALADQKLLLVLGPPGQGKTWACDRLTRDLTEKGWLVVNHYCYLNTAEDEHKDKRVKLETVIGSLLAQLSDAEPSCVEQLQPRYAVSPEALVKAVQKIRMKDVNQPVALIIDGIDHVTRVLGSTTGQLDPATALSQELALLDLPAGSVVLANGSKSSVRASG